MDYQTIAISETINTCKSIGYPSYMIGLIEEILIIITTKGGSYQDLETYFIKRNLQLGIEKNKYLNDPYQTIVTISNLYSACYNYVFTSELGLEWYHYSGSILSNSRSFCKACVKKEYIHVSEFPQIITGDFSEYKKIRGSIDKKTGLATKLYSNTTIDNFMKLRGGDGCGHQMLAVDDSIVPKSIKDTVFATQAYKIWKIK